MQACCKCSGGLIQATPFEYVSKPVAVGFPLVVGYPQPRTASAYTINSDCELAEYGLTIDGTTGQLQGIPKTDEPARIQCTITALQLQCETKGGNSVCKTVESPHAADIIIDIGHIAYEKSTLICYKGQEQYTPIKSGHGNSDVEWSEFTINCVPKLTWMMDANQQNGGFNHATGQITCPSNALGVMNGGVTNVDDIWSNQGGAVCTVSAKEFDRGDPDSTKPNIRTTMVNVLRPKPWANLIYSQYRASATIGEVSPVLSVEPPPGSAGPGAMAPTRFIADCSVSPSTLGSEELSFAYDEMHNTGLVAGFPAFEIAEDGSITAMPADGMVGLFNADTRTPVRKSITVTCDVFGLYPDPAINAGYGAAGALKSADQIVLTLTDNMCWIRQNLAVAPWGTVMQKNEATCRAECRESPMCAFYAVSNESECQFFYRKMDQTGAKRDVTAKVTDCTNDRSCLSVAVEGNWVASGSYCPVGNDNLRGMVYEKEGVAEGESMYLARFLASRDGNAVASDGAECANNDWVVRRASEADFIDEEKNIMDLKGPIVRCLKPNAVESIFNSATTVELQKGTAGQNVIEGQFVAQTCSPLNVTMEGEDSVVQVFKLDDKETSQAADFWVRFFLINYHAEIEQDVSSLYKLPCPQLPHL